MIELSAIDRFANQISGNQKRFILTLDGLFHRLKTKNSTTVAEFKREAGKMMESHLDDLKRIADDTLPVIAFLAGTVDQHVAPKEYLLDTMRNNTIQSISLFANVLRRVHFDRRLGESAQTRGVVIKQLDRIGRKGKPERFAYLSARKAALDTFNDSKFVSNREDGIVSHLRYKDSGRKLNGVPVTQHAEDGAITYEVAREKIFHPQSQAVLD